MSEHRIGCAIFMGDTCDCEKGEHMVCRTGPGDDVDEAARVGKMLREAGEKADAALADEPMLSWFKYEHLKPELRKVSQTFAELAQFVVITIPKSAERTVALRKILEGKDAAVRAAMI